METQTSRLSLQNLKFGLFSDIIASKAAMAEGGRIPSKQSSESKTVKGGMDLTTRSVPTASTERTGKAGNATFYHSACGRVLP